MYEFLTGRIVDKQPTSIILDVNNIGYYLRVPVSTYTRLPEISSEVKILTHLIVREDAHQLFGFLLEEERQIFRMLISVSGIGPKVAITVLSGLPIAEFKQAIIGGSLGVLTSISGIGKKTAERMIIELREKIVVDEQISNFENAGQGAPAGVVEDSLQALVELGYRKPSAKQAIEKVLKNSEDEELTVSDLIRASLKHM